jgi:hypothetical protein
MYKDLAAECGCVSRSLRGVTMRRLVLAMLVAAALFLSSASAASATIHPIMLGWVCGAASGNPPGQTPGGSHADQSTFRALVATGVITFDAQGNPVIDLTRPASKFITFDPTTDTGTSDHPGYINCADL